MVRKPCQGLSLIVLGLITVWPLLAGAERRSPQSPILSNATPVYLPLLANLQLSRPDVVEPSTVVRIDGSDTMVVVNDQLKQGFESTYEDTQVEVRNNGTQSALDALVWGDIDLAAIGRQLTSEERNQGIVQVTLKREKIAVIVGPDNPFDGDLTLSQFARIFRGEITNWAEIGGESRPIRFIDRPDDSDVRLALREYGTFRSAPFASGPTSVKVALDDTNAVIAELGRDGIGYAPTSHVLNLDTVRLVSMHNVLPTNPDYPYSQARAYAYFDPPSEAAIAFLGYGASPDGQANIQAALAAEAEAIATGVPISAAVAFPANDTLTDQPTVDSTATVEPDTPEPSDNAIGTSNPDASGQDTSNPTENGARDNAVEGSGAEGNADASNDGPSETLADAQPATPANATSSIPDNSEPSDSELSDSELSDSENERQSELQDTPPPDTPPALPVWFWWILPVIILALLLWKWLGSKTGTIAYSNEGDRSEPETDVLGADVPDPSVQTPDPEAPVFPVPDLEAASIPETLLDSDFGMDNLDMDDITEDMEALEALDPPDEALDGDMEAMEAIETFTDDDFQPTDDFQPIDNVVDTVADDFLSNLPEPDDFILPPESELESPLFMETQLLLPLNSLPGLDNVAALIAQGHTLAESQQYQAADASFDSALGLQPDSGAALAGKGRVALAMGKPDVAIAHFNAATTHSPDNATIALYQGHAYTEMQQLEDALAAYNRSVQLDANLLEATLGKGKILSALGQPQNAIVCFNHILDILLKPTPWHSTGAIAPSSHPSDRTNIETTSLGLPLLSPVALESQALQGRGNALLTHGYIGAALDNLEKAADTDPTNPDLWVALGHTLAGLQREQEAIASFDRALVLAPNHPGAQRGKELARK